MNRGSWRRGRASSTTRAGTTAERARKMANRLVFTRRTALSFAAAAVVAAALSGVAGTGGAAKPQRLVARAGHAPRSAHGARPHFEKIFPPAGGAPWWGGDNPPRVRHANSQA